MSKEIELDVYHTTMTVAQATENGKKFMEALDTAHMINMLIYKQTDNKTRKQIMVGKLDCRLSTIKLINESLEIARKNKSVKYTGVIVKSETDFSNTIYRAIIEELQNHEHLGKYKGNSHHLAQRLVELLVAEINKAECTIGGLK